MPIYATGDAAFAPYAYHYTPPFAQILAPLTPVVPTLAYLIGFRALLILMTWDLAGRRLLATLALIAFLPAVPGAALREREPADGGGGHGADTLTGDHAIRPHIR